MIICLCSVVTPTYCATTPPSDTYSIQQGVSFDKGQNYYTENNLKFVSINGFELSRKNDIVCFFNLTWNDALRSILNTTYLDVQDLYINHYGEKIFIGTLSVEYQFFTQADNFFYVKQLGYTFDSVPFNVPLDLYYTDWSTISLSLPTIPYDYLMNYISGNIALNIWQVWDFAYTIDYNGQYFYNDYFGIYLYRYFPFYTMQYDQIANQKRVITLTDNNDAEFIGTFTDASAFYSHNILFNNRYNYENSYITKVRLKDTFNDMIHFILTESDYKNDGYGSMKWYFSDNISFNLENNPYSEGNECMTLYSANSKGQEALNSTLIPIGANQYYKSGEWYDIPTHLYNFFIYLIFDAPIISNFTRLVLVIINFIVELFTFLIGLFEGFESVFFISLFVGFIVLIFLLKIIFKG